MSKGERLEASSTEQAGSAAKKSIGIDDIFGNGAQKTLSSFEHESEKILKAGFPGLHIEGRESVHPSPALEHVSALSSQDSTQKQKLEDKTGVIIEEQNGKLEYHVKAQGKDRLLFQTSADANGLKEGEERLHRIVLAKEHELNQKFAVTFAAEGDLITDPRSKKSVKARDPRFEELYGVEEALYLSQPSTLTKEGKGIKINFLDGVLISGAAAYADPLVKGELFIQPSNAKEHNATEADAPYVWYNDPKGIGRHSLTGLLLHEIGHLSQQKMGWDDSGTENKIAAQIGWQKSSNGDEWLIKDNQGHLYKRWDHDGQNRWVMSDEAGVPVSQTHNGKPVYLADDQMSQVMQVLPMTTYITNPVEMYADGVQYYRLNAQARKAFHDKSPAFYQVVKSEDQREIDMAYGAGKYIRLPGGTIVENNAANRKSVNDFER